MENLKSGIIGFVVGDVMGVPVEFVSREYLFVEPVSEMLAFGSHAVPKGCWSDDTSMVLATIDSMVQCKEVNYNDIADKFLDWLSEAKYTSTDKIFDIGITTKQALINYREGNHEIDATKCGGGKFNSNGNGSLMRILPLAYYFYHKKIDKDEEMDIIRGVSLITHSHEISILGCYIYVKYVLSLLEGLNKEEAYKKLQEYDYKEYFEKENIDVYKRIINGELEFLELDDIESGGFVVHTLEAVIWCFLRTNNYKEAVLKAINLGGDTDTIGALTGGLAGIYYGYKSIPKEWENDLLKKDYLEELIGKFEAFLK